MATLKGDLENNEVKVWNLGGEKPPLGTKMVTPTERALQQVCTHQGMPTNVKNIPNQLLFRKIYTKVCHTCFT